MRIELQFAISFDSIIISWEVRDSKMPVDVTLYVVYFIVLVILLILVRVSLVNSQGQTRPALR